MQSSIEATASAWAECAMGSDEMFNCESLVIIMNSWEVLFHDIELCACMNCKEKWAKA